MKSVFPQSFIDEMTALLNTKEAQLIEELERITKESRPQDDHAAREQYGDSEDDSAQEMAELSNLVSLEETLEKELEDVRKTRTRIKEGVYGICQHCTQPIDERRLRARPTSSSCITCKKALKQEV